MRLTTKQVCELLNVTPMTVHQYRKGTPTKDALPFEKDGRHVFFDQKQVRAWAKVNGVSISRPMQTATGSANRRRAHRSRKPKS